MPEEASFRSPAAVTTEERALLLRLAYRMCWSGPDAEDVLQDALLAAARHAAGLRDPERRWPWLCRIVVQHCRLHSRKNRHSQRAARRLPGPIEEVAVVLQNPEPASEELGILMKRLLVKLPEKQRIAVTLRHIEHMDYPRIAEIMRVSESTVRAHVQAGRDHLRRLILARHPEWQA